MQIKNRRNNFFFHKNFGLILFYIVHKNSQEFIRKKAIDQWDKLNVIFYFSIYIFKCNKLNKIDGRYKIIFSLRRDQLHHPLTIKVYKYYIKINDFITHFHLYLQIRVIEEFS